MAKGLARKISRRQALTYERTAVNGRGVTTLVSVNGRGAAKRASSSRAAGADYDRRYEATRKILRGGKSLRANRPAPAPEPAGVAVRTHRIVDVDESETHRIIDVGEARPSSRASGGDDGVKAHRIVDVGESAKPRKAKKETMSRKKSGKGRKKARSPAQRAATKRMLAAAAAKRGGRSAGRTASGAKPKAKSRRSAKATQGRRYGGFRTVEAVVGGKPRKTYAFRRPGGGLGHVPRYAILGMKSEKALQSVLQGSDTAAAEALSKKMGSIFRQRKRAAARVLAHGDVFTPNTVVPFDDWSENMTPNKRSKRKRKRSGASAKQIAAAKRNIKKAQRAKARHASQANTRPAKAPKRAKKGSRKSNRSPAQRAATKRMLAAAAAKRGRKTSKRGRKTSVIIRGSFGGKRSKRGTASPAARAAARRGRAQIRDGLHALEAYHFNGAGEMTPNRRKRRRKPSKSRGKFSANGFMAWLKDGFTKGAVSFGGFVVHRAATRGIEQLLSMPSVPAMDSSVKRGIALFLAAAIGIPAAMTVLPKQGGLLVAGMVVSALQDVATIALAKANVPPTYFAGLGEYMPAHGLGAYELMPVNGYEQAVAGFGAASFQQAAAGYGSSIHQAAAGYGAAPIQQAAAGYGEYVANQNLRGIGEYELTGSMNSSVGAYVDEGIRPDMNSAERALVAAEAMAGVGDCDGDGDGTGNDDVSDVNTWQAGQTDAALDDGDGADFRSGSLKGSGGIFG